MEKQLGQDIESIKILLWPKMKCPREGETVPAEPNTSSSGGEHGNVKDIESADEFNSEIKGDKLVMIDFFAT